MQENPADPTTYKPVGNDIDITNVTSFEELPIFEYGCDSAYSVAKRFRDLAHSGTAQEICNELQGILRNDSNPEGLFQHPQSKQHTDMCFTGGEPLIKTSQNAIVDIMDEFAKRRNCPTRVTVETNGTKKLEDNLYDLVKNRHSAYFPSGTETEWFWSVSPKLLHTSGEQPKKALKPEFVAKYAEASNSGQLKYVVNGTEESWNDVEEATKMFRDVGVEWPVYIMIAGATKEQQEADHVAKISDEALARGYHVSGRLHCFIYGNALNT